MTRIAGKLPDGWPSGIKREAFVRCVIADQRERIGASPASDEPVSKTAKAYLERLG